jgi:hypothetical protein
MDHNIIKLLSLGLMLDKNESRKRRVLTEENFYICT